MSLETILAEELDEETFNRLTWEPLDGQTLGQLIAGLQTIGAEPIDYPLTDGAILYFRKPSGGLLLIELSVDPFSEEQADSTEPFMEIRKAEVG